MADVQILTVALASVPTMITVLIGILINNARMNDLNTRMGDLRAYMDARFNEVDRHFNNIDRRVDTRFDEVDRRLDEMKDLWRSELHRVEEVLDARLKHLEGH